MSVNRYSQHLQVLPEDDANRQFINGLELQPSLCPRRLQVLPLAGGWQAALDRLSAPDVVQGLVNYEQRHLLLLIDFDSAYDVRWRRYQELRDELPRGVADRVFLLGCRDEPESFRAACLPRLTLEKLGRELAGDCEPPPATNLWQHDQLRHNAGELARLVAQVKPFLFQS